MTRFVSANGASRLAHAIRSAPKGLPFRSTRRLLESGTQHSPNPYLVANKTSAVRREATTALLGQLLTSRTTSGAVCMVTVQPRNIVQFLCWLDSCSNRRQKVVHAMHCTQVGTAELSGCSTIPGNVQSGTHTIPLGRTTCPSWSWRTSAISASLSTGEMPSAIGSDLITQHMTFTREEQKKAGVAVKQAPIVLPGHLHAIVFPLRARLQCTSDLHTRTVLARDLSLFTVAFETTKRDDKLSRTLVQRILRLPDLSGFLFNFQWEKTVRDGADHLISIAYNHECLVTCPVTSVEQLIAVGSAMG